MIQKDELQRRLMHTPTGHLTYSKNGNSFKYFQSDGKTATYIAKKNRELAEGLAIKKYYSKQLEEIEAQLKILSKSIAEFDKIKFQSETFLSNNSPFHVLLQKHFQTFSDKLDEWEHEEYEQSDLYLEHLVHRTMKGHFVRSKSEVIIANALYLNHIPYRYECKMQIHDSIFFPDFTICHPETMKIYYWEHFGMIDETNYCNHFLKKMKIYIANGIIPSVNLITTYETKEFPIDSEKVQRIMEEYFR